MTARFTMPITQWISSLGVPLSGAKLYFYAYGTATPLDTYSDSANTTPNTNPVVADSTGTWGSIFLGAALYKVDLRTSTGSQVTGFPIEPVSGNINQYALSSYATLALADAAAVAGSSALIIDSNVTLSGNTVIAAKEVIFQGGKITRGSYTLTFSGAVTAGNVPIFDTAGSGAISMANNGRIELRWFGALGDGVDDTNALAQWQLCAATSVSGTGASTAVAAPGTYTSSARIPFYASVIGSGREATVFKPKAAFAFGYLFDFNYGAANKEMMSFSVVLDGLGTGGAVKAFGSSSTGGGGGSSGTYMRNITITSLSTSTYAFAMTSSVTEPGAFTFLTADNLKVSAPLTIQLGQNQNGITLNTPVFDNGAGGVNLPFAFLGDCITLNSPSFEVVDVAASGNQAFVDIGVGIVNINAGYMESTATIANGKWGFFCATSGPHGTPQCHLNINGLSLNVDYSGANTDQALIRVNINSTAGSYGQWISLTNVETKSGGNTCWDHMFNIYSGAAGASGPLALLIEHVDEFAAISRSATGCTATGANVVVKLRGHWRTDILNHTAPCPAAGNPLTWTWVLPGASFAA